MYILSGLGMVLLFLAVCLVMRGRQSPLSGDEIRSLRRFSDRIRRDAGFPFE